MTKIILQALFIAAFLCSISATFSTGANEGSSIALSDLSSQCLVSNILFSSQGWHKSSNEWRRLRTDAYQIILRNLSFQIPKLQFSFSQDYQHKTSRRS